MKTNPTGINRWSAAVRRWITHDWEAKLVCLVLACLVWYMVKDMVAREHKFDMPKGWAPPQLLPPAPAPVPRV